MSSVIAQLKEWGPDTTELSIGLPEAQRYTWSLASSHYENFPVISWAVPKHLRQDFANLYAFCRWADDLGDETGSTEQSLTLLNWWLEELEKCYQGDSSHPVYVALNDTVTKHSIPIDPFRDLISAFVQDQTVSAYETFAQLHDYCRRSANPVGRLVLFLAGRVTDQNIAWSDSICTGLQLVNFWQDVARDWRIGRVYLPREDRLHFGCPDEAQLEQQNTAAFRNLLKFEVDRARQFLLAGRPLVAQMPGRLKVDIDLFIRGGLLIAREIENIGYDVWHQRPVVRKSQLMLEMIKSIVSLPFVKKTAS